MCFKTHKILLLISFHDVCCAGAADDDVVAFHPYVADADFDAASIAIAEVYSIIAASEAFIIAATVASAAVVEEVLHHCWVSSEGAEDQHYPWNLYAAADFS